MKDSSWRTKYFFITDKILIHYELDHLLLLDTEATADGAGNDDESSRQPQMKWTLLDKLVKETASFDN